MGYSMSADEVKFWQDQAALLDPLAYVFLHGTSQTHTVAADERDYLMGGWLVQPITSGAPWFHRKVDIDNAVMLTAGTAVTTDASNAGSYMLICQPSLVTGSDSRYTSDPRALYFTRWITIGTRTEYDAGVSITASTNGFASLDFPTDFTYGLALHTSQHDISWVGLQHTGADLTMACLDEIGDNNTSRFTSRTLFPFTRATFPTVYGRGASGGVDTGRGNVTYIKLPGGW
jgi:hypothetical protein